jgi:hypothetical protein
MWILTIILILVGGGLVYASRNVKKKLETMAGVETSQIADLQKRYTEVTKEIGSGSFEQVAEIKGVISCDQPLASEITRKPCAYYTMRVIREWEETYSEYNSQTQRHERKTRRGSEIMSQNTQMIPFWVRDQTAQILVNPAGAEIEAVQVIDQFQPEGPQMQGGTVTLGSLSFHFGMPKMMGDRQTLGYRFQESILPLEQNVYILGVASDSSGALSLQNPRDKGQRFLISLKSEEELLASGQSTMKWLQIGAIVCVALGLILLIATLVA